MNDIGSSDPLTLAAEARRLANSIDNNWSGVYGATSMLRRLANALEGRPVVRTMNVICLTEGQTVDVSEVQDADLIVSADGRVLKSRYGRAYEQQQGRR